MNRTVSWNSNGGYESGAGMKKGAERIDIFTFSTRLVEEKNNHFIPVNTSVSLSLLLSGERL